jgi:plastocyanin
MEIALLRPSSRLAVAGVLVILAAGCGTASSTGSGSGSGGGAPATAGAAPAASDTANTVQIKNFAFTPAALTVPTGTEVAWDFDDSVDHTVVADDNSFSSKPEGSGQSYTHTFGTTGTVAYHCSIHPFMKATIIVK